MPEICSICLEPRRFKSIICGVRTRCSHAFCHTCFEEWIKRNTTCPLCRARCVHTEEEARELAVFFQTNSVWILLVYVLNAFYMLLKLTEEHSDVHELEIYPAFVLVLLMLGHSIYTALTRNAELNFYGQGIHPRMTREVYCLLNGSLVLASLLPGYTLVSSVCISIRLYQVMRKCPTGCLIYIYAVFVVGYSVPKLEQVLVAKAATLMPRHHAAPVAPCFLARTSAGVAILLLICIAHAFFGLIDRLLTRIAPPFFALLQRARAIYVARARG
jgi:uncharacterized protein (DUF983 family)